MDPMFTPPAPGHPGGPGPSLPLTPSFSPPALPASSPKQLTVRTRSIGTNTQEGGISGALEGDPTCLGPCQPGTSVNLEGIVWHETEEGQQSAEGVLFSLCVVLPFERVYQLFKSALTRREVELGLFTVLHNPEVLPECEHHDVCRTAVLRCRNVKSL